MTVLAGGAMKPIDVCIPTKNRPTHLALALSSLYHQTYRGFDVIVVDDSATPVSTVPIIKLWSKMLADNGIKVTFYRGTGAGPQSAHNVSLHKTRKEWLLRFDDDCYIAPNYIEKLLGPGKEFLSNQKVGAVGGSVPYVRGYDVLDTAPPDEYGKMLKQPDGTVVPYEQQTVVYNVPGAYYVTHIRSSFMYRVAAAGDVGGYPTEYSNVGHREETHFTAALHFAGYDCIVVPSAVCWHFQDYEGIGGIREGYENDDDPKLRKQQDADEKKFQEWVKGAISRGRKTR